MNSAVKTLLLLVLLAGAGLGLYLATSGSHDPAPIVPAQTDPQKPADPTPPEVKPVEAQPQPRVQAPQREAVDGLRSGADLPQGFKARVLDPNGAPVVGAEVYLKEGVGSNLFMMMQLAQKGLMLPPIASSKTDNQGTFKLGMEIADAAKVYEIAVVSTQWKDQKLPNLHVRPSEWYDLGTITLEKGAHLHGRVTIAGSGGLPVPNALVTIKNVGGFPEVSPIPGHENGIPVKADANGAYVMENAPVGIVNIAAVAPGFARLEHQGFQISPGDQNERNFELATGLSVAGIVTDASGAPVGDVRLTALAISSKTPLTSDTRSGSNGKFEIIGLLEGPYILKANAIGFIEHEVKPVHAGDAEVTVVLEKQGSARVIVYGKNDRLLTSYTLTLKTYFEGQKYYGNSEIPPMTPRVDKEGVATVAGVNPGHSYVFQVDAQGYAKAYSDPFLVAVGAEPPLVIVHMNEGGVIEGSVLGPNGQPLASVTVGTLPNEFDENPFTDMFKDLMPIQITRTQVQTGPDGRFRIALLNPGDYQLKIVHPDYFQVFLKNQKVETGVTTQVPPITMQPGTVLTGQVLIDGKPGGQVKVTINTLPDATPPQPGQPAPQTFSCETFTDAEGKFTMPKRIPPGRYQCVAMRQSVENPLFALLDVMKTKQEIEIFPDQATRSITINIASQ